jgi:hypothetical protein
MPVDHRADLGRRVEVEQLDRIARKAVVHAHQTLHAHALPARERMADGVLDLDGVLRARAARRGIGRARMYQVGGATPHAHGPALLDPREVPHHQPGEGGRGHCHDHHRDCLGLVVAEKSHLTVLVKFAVRLFAHLLSGALVKPRLDLPGACHFRDINHTKTAAGGRDLVTVVRDHRVEELLEGVLLHPRGCHWHRVVLE